MKTDIEKPDHATNPNTQPVNDSVDNIVGHLNPPARLQKEWWVTHDGNVIRVTGYACGPTSPEMWWWCPQIGYTCTEGHSLFETEAEALQKALAKAKRQATEWGAIVKRLNARMQNTAHEAQG